MYIVSLHYTAALEAIDALIPEHVRWLEAAYADGLFLASGRKVPRSGGIIFARAMPRAELEQRLAQDPFSRHGVADYSITEFVPSMTSPALACLQEN